MAYKIYLWNEFKNEQSELAQAWIEAAAEYLSPSVAYDYVTDIIDGQWIPSFCIYGEGTNYGDESNDVDDVIEIGVDFTEDFYPGPIYCSYYSESYDVSPFENIEQFFYLERTPDTDSYKETYIISGSDGGGSAAAVSFSGAGQTLWIIYEDCQSHTPSVTGVKFALRDNYNPNGSASGEIIEEYYYPEVKKLSVPTNLQSSFVYSRQINLKWNESENAVSYEIARCDSSGTTTYETKTATGTSVSFTRLSQGTTYYFKIKAVGDGADYSDSDYSNVVEVKTHIAILPPDVSATSTTTTITLTWDEVPNVARYVVFVKDLDGDTYRSVGTVTTTTFTLESLLPDTTYSFEVLSIGSDGYYDPSSYSSSISVTTKATGIKLGTPTGLTVTNNAVITTKAKSTVSWTAVDNTTSYKLEYKKSSATTWTSVSTTKVSYALTSLDRNTSYDFRITAIGDGTTYLDSDVSSTVTKTTKSQLATPKNLTCTSKTATSLTFSWTAVSGTKTYYLGYKLPSSSSWDCVHPTTNSAAITGLSSGTTYNIRLSARTPTNSTTYDGSAYTSTINATTLIPLAAPSNLNASNVTSTSAKVSWNSVNNATGYKVEFRKSGTSSWLVANE